ncbi:MAG: hypothetical protein F6K54_28495 [Okeania sp. SIO3B5]|uniref:hypothetical protein n=1 Tax=Okeania sp. SIO3B5 TaxID=2607811 RepID=UPI00140121C5|nr:hypothetical protein [Okeania sp. SIO3B5]NEO56668.1 hypothetical protein [Okeania sp. SIO3B5]
MSDQSDEYSNEILDDSSHLSYQNDHLSSPSSGYPDRPEYGIPTTENIDENQSPYSFANESNDYETGKFDNNYNYPYYGEDNGYYLPTSNQQETETQDLNYALDNHSDNFSPYSINSTRVNYAHSWEYSNQYSLGSPYMNQPQLQNNSSSEDSDTDDDNSGNSNLSQNGTQNSTQTSIETILSLGFSTFSLGFSLRNGELNITHFNIEGNTITSHNSENTNIHGDQIEQHGSFGIGISLGEIEHQNTNIGVGYNNGKINTDTLTENIYEAQEKTLAETTPEMQEFFQKLEKFNSIETKIPNLTFPKEIEMFKNNFVHKEQIIRVWKPHL